MRTIFVLLILSSLAELHEAQMSSSQVSTVGNLGLSSSCLGITLNWTSYENTQPTPLENSSIIVGNLILLNASASHPMDPNLDICNTSISLFIDGGGSVSNITNGTSASLLVPWLSYNITGSVHIESVACNGTRLGCSYTNLTFGNSFYPNLSDLHVSHENDYWTITWSASDKNLGDSLTFDVLMSADGGVAYQYIARDLNTSSFEWNATGFPKTDLAFLVRATDSRGLTKEIRYIGYRHVDIPTPTTPAISPSGDLEFVQGTSGHLIWWTVSAAAPFEYSILQNGVEVENGTWHSGVIAYSVDGLPPGSYTFVLQAGSLESDSVTVLVLVNWSLAVLQLAGVSAIAATVVISIYYYTRRHS